MLVFMVIYSLMTHASAAQAQVRGSYLFVLLLHEELYRSISGKLLLASNTHNKVD